MQLPFLHFLLVNCLEFSLLYNTGHFYLCVILVFLLIYCTAHLNMNHTVD